MITDPITIEFEPLDPDEVSLARFLPPHQDIEDRLAAWEIIPMPEMEESAAQAA